MIYVTPVILCGGSGTGLWPISRAGFPKQFLSLTGSESLFQQVAKRLVGLGADDTQVANLGTIPLEIIEVQSGRHFGEDDIVCFKYTFGRVQS